MTSPPNAARLDVWLTTLVLRYRSRILPFGEQSADQWGRVMALHPTVLAVMDGLAGVWHRGPFSYDEKFRFYPKE